MIIPMPEKTHAESLGAMELYLDSDSKRIRQKFYQFFNNEKFKKILYFFICILPDYVPHEIAKEF